MTRALSLNLPNGLAVHDPRSFQGRPLSFAGFISVPPPLRKTSHCKTHLKHSSDIRMQMGEEEDESVKQMKEMAAARKRWEALVRQGKVVALSAKEAGYAVQLSNKSLLDVRPSVECKKVVDLIWFSRMNLLAYGLCSRNFISQILLITINYYLLLYSSSLQAWVKGSTWIPLFDVDGKLDMGTLSRKMTNFLMGGWWSGAPTLAYQTEFIQKVEEKFPKDADLIVACQKGLRSLAACEQLYNAGYRKLFWIQGGLESAEDGDLEREGPQPFKFAAIGGVSEFLGWTDQQRAAAAKEGWGYRLVFSARLVGLFLLADALFIGVRQAGSFLQDLRLPY